MIGNAIRVARIATGEEEETVEPDDGEGPGNEGAREEGRGGEGEGFDAREAG